MSREFFAEYLKKENEARKQLLYIMNPAKFRACQKLVQWHEGAGHKASFCPAAHVPHLPALFPGLPLSRPNSLPAGHCLCRQHLCPQGLRDQAAKALHLRWDAAQGADSHPRGVQDPRAGPGQHGLPFQGKFIL